MRKKFKNMALKDIQLIEARPFRPFIWETGIEIWTPDFSLAQTGCSRPFESGQWRKDLSLSIYLSNKLKIKIFWKPLFTEGWAIWFTFQFLSFYFYLFEIQRKTGRCSKIWIAGSLIKCLQLQRFDQVKTRSQKLNSGLSCGRQEPNHLSHDLLPARAWIRGKIESGGNVGFQNSCMRCKCPK